MAEHEDLHKGPQRQAIPRMATFILVIVLIAIGILCWFALGN